MKFENHLFFQANTGPDVIRIVITVLHFTAEKCHTFSATTMGIYREQSQQKLATIVVCFGFLSLNSLTFLVRSFCYCPDGFVRWFILCLPSHVRGTCSETCPVVRDQQKLGHISFGNNSIEMRTERCGCC